MRDYAIAFSFHLMVPAVDSFTRWPPGNDDRQIIDPWRAFASARNERVSEVFNVVALGEIAALMGPARLLAIERAMHDGFSNVEHKAQFERCGELRVEATSVVVEPQSCSAFFEFIQLVGRFDQSWAIAVDTAAALHRTLHFLAQFGNSLDTVILAV